MLAYIEEIMEEENTLSVLIERSKIRSNNLELIEKIYDDSVGKLSLISLEEKEGFVHFNYKKDYKDEYERIYKFDNLKKLEILSSVKFLEQFFTGKYVSSLDPQNLALDFNNNIILKYVGIKDITPPDETESCTYLDAYKALILDVFSSYKFQEILDANFNLKFNTPMQQEILACADLSQVEEVLQKLIIENTKEYQLKYEYVNKKKYKRNAAFAIVFPIVLVVVGFLFVRLQFFTVPTQELGLETSAAFIEHNYGDVTTLLHDKSADDMTDLQKYELAYSTVKLSSLDDTQKKQVLSTLTTSSNEQVYKYWIAMSREKYSDAIDYGKALLDNNLVVYALRNEIIRLEADTNVKGAVKEEKLKSLKEDLSKYESELGIVQEDTKTDAGAGKE